VSSNKPKVIDTAAKMPGVLWKRISVGNNFFCATTTANMAYCWGSNSYGQLGSGPSPSSTTDMVAVVGNKRFKSVASTLFSTCGVLA
jgi:alpha-tubulin suppressor-like RCC1 family protein